MSIHSSKIGEKISALYEEMEYDPKYTIQQFEADFEVEKRNPLPIPEHLKENDSKCNWILRFRNVFERRRGILTKLFAFTNNLNNVDTLIEYCDYYISYFDDVEINQIPVRLSTPDHMLYFIFLMIAKNETTAEVCPMVWEMLHTDTNLKMFNPAVEILQSGLFAMVIMADSDLHAAVQAWTRSLSTYFQVARILVQEPVKEQLVNELNCCGSEIAVLALSNLYVFRNNAEVLENLSSKEKFTGISLWSENIVAAKKIARNVRTGIIWINAHGVLGAGLHSTVHISESLSVTQLRVYGCKRADDSAKIALKSIRTFNLFYGGKWQIPTDEKYWTGPFGVCFAQATRKDVVICATAARRAFKIWSSKKLSQRAKIIKYFAERLRALGNSDDANVVLQCVDRSLQFGNTLTVVKDGEAEILSTQEPVGVVLITAYDQKMLMAELTIASVTGNAVIVIIDHTGSASFARYCDLVTTCGFPPGVINCLSTTNPSDIEMDQELINAAITDYAVRPSQIVLDLYQGRALEDIKYNKVFIRVTQPKSIWLQCG